MIVVAHVLPDLAVGGGQRLLAWLAAADDHVRHEFFSLGPGPMEAELAALGSTPTIAAGSSPREQRRELAAMVERVGAQVIHFHTPEQRRLAVAAARAVGIGVVGTFHGLTAPTPPAASWRRRPWSAAARAARTRIRRTRTSRGVAALTAVSEAARRLQSARNGIDPAQITVVRPGLPRTAFAPPAHDRRRRRAELGIGPEAPVMITVGSLTPSKGSLLLPRFLDCVVAEIGEARLLVVGDGPARDELRRLIDAVGLGDNVVFCGRRSESEVMALIDCADLFVSTSLSESFGLAVLEGMARGCPVVGFHTGGFDEFFVPGVTGELIEGTDPNELAAVATRWLSDPRRRADAGRDGAQRARDFTVEQTAAEFEAVYRRVIG